MSLLSRITRLFAGTPTPEQRAPAEAHASRHERREAGRQRHHETGQPAWEASDRLDQPAASDKDPDAAPEILGGG
jgi:hypothetical protein